MIPQHASDKRDAMPARSQALVDWLDRHYDMPRHDHSGPEAMAWDGQGLKAVTYPPHAVAPRA